MVVVTNAPGARAMDVDMDCLTDSADIPDAIAFFEGIPPRGLCHAILQDLQDHPSADFTGDFWFLGRVGRYALSIIVHKMDQAIDGECHPAWGISEEVEELATTCCGMYNFTVEDLEACDGHL